MERLFNLDAQLLFDACVMALSMLVMFTFLSYLLFKPVRKLLEDRKQRVADEQESAKNDRKEAAVYKEEYEQKLKEIDKEAQAILSEARKKAMKTENEIVAEAKEEAYNDAVEAAAIDLAVENAEIVELPEEMIHEEVHRSINEFLGNMQRQGISPEMYFQITGTTQDDLHKQYEAEAESRTKTNLVVEAVAKSEGFEATEEEINAEIEQLAADYNMPVEQVRNLLSPEMLKHDITVKKAVNVITSTAKVK